MVLLLLTTLQWNGMTLRVSIFQMFVNLKAKDGAQCDVSVKGESVSESVSVKV